MSTDFLANPMNLPVSIALADLVMALGEVDRATQHPDGRPETDTTHSCMLALLATCLMPYATVDLSPGLVTQFALVHDLVEAHAGDTNTARGLTDEARKEKEAREAAALERIRTEVGFPWIADTIDRYEAQEEPEARFVRYLDKIICKLTHLLNGGSALRAIGMGHAEMKEKHAAQGAYLRGKYPEFTHLHRLFNEVCDACEGQLKLVSCAECVLFVEESCRCDACLPLPDALPIAPIQSQAALPRSEGAWRIDAERARQMDDEGWSPERDQGYTAGELALAAVAYATPPGIYARSTGNPWGGNPPIGWPWDARRWKPWPENRIRELEKAGALIAAEIDRLIAAEREEAAPETPTSQPTTEELFAAEHDHPSRYQPGPYEAIKVIEAWGAGFCVGNALKYLCRYPHKGTPEDDLRKALWYVERAIAHSEGAFTLADLERSRALGRVRPPEVVEAWGLSGTPAADAVINLAIGAPEHAARNIRDQLAQTSLPFAA